MKEKQALAMIALFAATCFLAHTAIAQAVPAATQKLQLSAFAAGTGTFTDLEGGKNLAITAGIDLAFLFVSVVRPSFELRGSYPIDGGKLEFLGCGGNCLRDRSVGQEAASAEKSAIIANACFSFIPSSDFS